MELKVSSSKLGGLSPPDCISDPEEQEVSDEDDDDRNHKHRRRETRSQSLERDSIDQVYTRPYRKRNKPFENGFRENESQGSEAWKTYNISPLEKDFTAKVERRRPGLTPFPRASLDVNQRIRANQPFIGDLGPGRGRGRDSVSWNQRDSRFNSVDIASLVQPGSVAPGLFAGRGLPNVSNAQTPSWSAFGLIPGIPNGGLDTLHSIGLQGTLRPMNSSLTMGIPRQRCRDFEERGFCLRGDMCPMEHGVNRIVVEDVQSLSQFNLPVSLPSAQLLATSAGPGPLPTVVAPSTTLINSKGVHSKSSKSGMTDDGFGLNGGYTGSTSASGADLYDPDQPLWNSNGPESSAALSALQSPKIDETEPVQNEDLSERHVRVRDVADNECLVRSSGTQGSSVSVWGRIGSTRNRLDAKEKVDATSSSSLENETKEDQGALPSSQGISRQGKRVSAEDDGSKAMDSTHKSHSDNMRNFRKPSQKALRTLFVNGIPQKSNRREALLSHFRKFGEIVDIYIPLNSERAFVQFSKREEAEAALKAPDAVMGNRFIKLWWANRDSIPDDGISSGNNSSLSVTPGGLTAAAMSAQPSAAYKGKDNLQLVAQKGNVVHGADVPAADSPMPVGSNGPKVPPPLQKKLESLEQLKEELRKKQESLDQKRNDFRRKLDKLEKQATGVKGEPATEQAAKRHKVGMAAEPEKAVAPASSDPGAAAASSYTEVMTDKNKSMENVVSQSPKSNTAMVQQEFNSLKRQIRPVAPLGSPFVMNRYKLDHRPTAFRVMPPLPTGFTDDAVLKEHFSQYGDLATVELEDVEANTDDNGSEVNCSALVTFVTRRAAERAFVNGKCWEGHNLQFMWLTSSNPSNDSVSKENLSSTPKGPLEANGQTRGKLECRGSMEADASGNGESDNLEIKGAVPHAELPEVSQPSPSQVSDEKESPTGDSS